MRIIILTHSKERHFYLVNNIIEKTESVVGVITGAKIVNRSRYENFVKKIKNIKYYLKNKFLNTIFIQYGKRLLREKELAEKKFFGGSTKRFYDKHKELLIATVTSKYRSINDDYYISIIKDKKPDVIIVMGTCLIGKEIISSAKFVINMHTGLSPYYRGGNTNLWPFIEKDFGYFGVTIHLMSLGIDSGNIIFTKSPEINQNDNYGTINSKSIVIGVNLIIESIKLIEKNQLNSIEQWTDGKLFFDRDWNNYLAYKYFKTKDKFLSEYCNLADNNRLSNPKIVKNGIVV